MKRTRVLVIEDDSAIRRGVLDALAFAGYETVEAAEGIGGGCAALEADFNLMLLDLVLPGRDGLDILQEVRTARPTMPVIILTARGSEDDRVRGLSLGADDYLIKPFSVRELMARIEAVLRRSPERASSISCLKFEGGMADLERREVCFDDGERCELSERENRLLHHLAIHGQRAISREEILSRVWGLDPRGMLTRTIDMHVARLRDKLRDNSGEPRIVLTVRGRGYKIGPGVATQ
jgi:DNA-binding response OmpR family regulator